MLWLLYTADTSQSASPTRAALAARSKALGGLLTCPLQAGKTWALTAGAGGDAPVRGLRCEMPGGVLQHLPGDAPSPGSAVRAREPAGAEVHELQPSLVPVLFCEGLPRAAARTTGWLCTGTGMREGNE